MEACRGEDRCPDNQDGAGAVGDILERGQPRIVWGKSIAGGQGEVIAGE
jgi:hypothetical protein